MNRPKQERGNRREVEDRRQGPSEMEPGDPYNRRNSKRRGRDRGRSLLEVPLTEEEEATLREFLGRYER